MATKVVNKRDFKGDGVYIGRPSRWGNPFPMRTEGDRALVITYYREWFLGRIEADKSFAEAVLELKGKTLICYCAPKACHGDVIVEYLEGNRG